MEKVVWCAELGSLHKCDPGLLFEMVRQSSLSGATLCKIQLGRNPDDPIRYIDKLAPQFVEWCNHVQVEPFASIWSVAGLQVAMSVGLKRYKIGHQLALSGKKEDGHLIDLLIRDNKETFISAPPSKNFRFRRTGIRWVFVQSSYPLFPIDLKLPIDFHKAGYYGYSSHAHGIGDALIAVSRGAKFVEKHVGLDRQLVTRDASFALTFEEFKKMTETGNEIARLL